MITAEDVEDETPETVDLSGATIEELVAELTQRPITLVLAYRDDTKEGYASAGDITICVGLTDLLFGKVYQEGLGRKSADYPDTSINGTEAGE